MRLIVLLALLGCGGSTASNECGSIRGQDCGASMNVTMKYSTASGSCSVTKTMSAEQFYWAVWPSYLASCSISEAAGSATVDCTRAGVPQGCNSGVCDWQPPVR